MSDVPIAMAEGETVMEAQQAFVGDDPFLLDEQSFEEERLVRDSARGHGQSP
jgi:hypothetical protein